MAAPLRDNAWLQWIERLLAAPDPEFCEHGGIRPVFRCTLDEMPDHLVPEAFLRSQASREDPGLSLIVNPHCWFADDGNLPSDFSRTFRVLRESLPEQNRFVYVKDPENGLIQPFPLGSAIGYWLRGIRSGATIVSDLPREIRQVLTMAGILLPTDCTDMRQQEWRDWISYGAKEFRKRGFIPVRQLIHPFHISGLRRYYRGLARVGLMTKGDAQCANRRVAHNDPLAKFFHEQLTPVVSALAGESIKPSYVYVASYENGAVLERHTDREQCEFSVSLCIDYAPEPQLQTAWPLQLHKNSVTTTVFQALGDGLLYRGCEIPHSRTTLPPGHTSTSAFFHYVRSDFEGHLN